MSKTASPRADALRAAREAQHAKTPKATAPKAKRPASPKKRGK